MMLALGIQKSVLRTIELYVRHFCSTTRSRTERNDTPCDKILPKNRLVVLKYILDLPTISVKPKTMSDLVSLHKERELEEQRRYESREEETQQIREAIGNETLPRQTPARRTPEKTLTDHRYGESNPDKSDVEIHCSRRPAIENGKECHESDEE